MAVFFGEKIEIALCMRRFELADNKDLLEYLIVLLRPHNFKPKVPKNAITYRKFSRSSSVLTFSSNLLKTSLTSIALSC